MSPSLTDPTSWLPDLLKSKSSVLWPTGDIADTSKALAAAAAPVSYTHLTLPTTPYV